LLFSKQQWKFYTDRDGSTHSKGKQIFLTYDSLLTLQRQKIGTTNKISFLFFELSFILFIFYYYHRWLGTWWCGTCPSELQVIFKGFDKLANLVYKGIPLITFFMIIINHTYRVTKNLLKRIRQPNRRNCWL